ncbi:hypothetical protein ABPG72_005812 [Tetrahymena utriculariae]
MSIFTSKNLKSQAVKLKDDQNQNANIKQSSRADCHTILTQENQQTDTQINSQREFMIQDMLQTQNGLPSKNDSQINSRGFQCYRNQNQNQKNDIENMLHSSKEDQQKQILKSNNFSLKKSQQLDHNNIDNEQIEIIEDNQNSLISPQQSTQRKQQKSTDNIQSFYQQQKDQNMNKQFEQINDDYLQKAIQIGTVQKAKLKDEESPQMKRQFDQKTSKIIISTQTSFKNYANNGQKLWSIVRRDIFYPIKFSGKVELGLDKKRKQRFKGSQTQKMYSSDPILFIDPYSYFKLFWDLFIGLIQLYFPLIFPVRIAFGLSNKPFHVIDVLIDLVFLIDMFFSCITGINQGGEVIKDRYFITKNYLRTYFAFDFISLIPYYFFVQELNYLKIFRLARYWDRYLLLLNKTVYFIFKGGSSHKFAVLLYYLFKVSSLILICVHVMTCWWIEIGQCHELGETDDFPQEFKQVAWVNTYYLQNPKKPQYGEFNKDIYITGYYYVTTTIATVGYGDLASKTVMEEFYTMFCEFFGIALFGYISGGLISAVQISLLVGTQKKNEMRSEFDQWLFQREKNREAPLFFMLLKNLRDINNFNTENNFSNFFNQQEYFQYLPKEQKRKIFNLIFTDIATFFGAFFRNINELSMIQDLFQYMHPLSFLPGAEIIKYRSLPRGLYLIVSGKIYLGTGKRINNQINQINSPNFKLNSTKNKKKEKNIEKQYFRKLDPGSFFGEFCLLEKNSSFNFVAGGKKIVNILYISKAKFLETCSKYKDSNLWLKKFAYYRFKYFKMEKYAYLKKINFYLKNKSKFNSNNNQNLSKFSKFKNIFKQREKSKEERINEVIEDDIRNEDSESDDSDQQNEQNNNNNNNKIEPINESNELDFSNSSNESQRENQQIIKETIDQQDNQNIEDKISSKKSILQLKKVSLLDQMQQKEDKAIPRISQIFKQQDQKRGAKSDLSLYLQHDQNDLKYQDYKKHKRILSQPINLVNDTLKAKDTIKKIKQDINPNTTTQQVRHGRVKSLEQNDRNRKKKHLKYQSLNVREEPQSKSKNKQSFNFYFNQIDEFSENGNINDPSDYQQQIQIPESKDNANQPYQFNTHFRDSNFNAFSPNSKENDKLISTPFSSNQQTLTRDTINNQKLQFSDDDQNSEKIRQGENKHFQINEINLDQIQRAFDDQRSQKTEQYHSCKIGLDSDNNFDQDLKIIDQLDSKNNQNELMQKQFLHRKDVKTLKQLEGIVNQQQNQKDFSKFQQNQASSQQFVQIKDANQSQPINFYHYQNAENHQQDFLSNIKFDEILTDSKEANYQTSIENQSKQNQMYAIQETNEEYLNENKQIENNQDLILFESSNNLSLFVDDEDDGDNNAIKNENLNRLPIQKEENQEQNDVHNLVDMSPLRRADEIIENSNKDESIQSQDIVDDLMNSSEEKELDHKIQNKKIANIRNDSVHHLKLIKEEEKKIRRAFRYQTSSNNKLEMLQTKKQAQIAEKVGVKIPYINQISSSRFKKIAQNKVMKKILNKKISILVQTVMQKAGTISNSNRQSIGNNFRSLNKNSIRYLSQPRDELNEQNAYDSQQFKEIMVSTPNSSASQEDLQSGKFFTFKEVVSQRSSMHSNQDPQIDINKCSSEFRSNSPSNNDLRSKSNSSPRFVTSQSYAPSPKNHHFSDKQKIQSMPKSKFSQNNDSKSPAHQVQSSTVQSEQNDKASSDSQSHQGDGGEVLKQATSLEVPNILIKDIVVEDDEKPIIEEDSEDRENQSEDLDIQINQIYNSRVPNFQLMLYIDKIVSEHKKKYEQGGEFFEMDDYQCYDEIENNEKQQDLGNSCQEQFALDNSIDIPIDIIKPNFDIQELQNLPSFLNSQLSIIENKIQQIVETTYDDCHNCLEKIKKLNSIKKSKKLSKKQIDESEAFQNLDNISNQENRGNSDSSNLQKITISNIINGSQQLPKRTFNNLNQKSVNVNEGSIQKNDDKNLLTPKKINLGFNLQFSIQDEADLNNQDEYNFFTELEKKNQIIFNQNQDQDDQLQKVKKLFGFTPKSKKNKIEIDLPQGMETVEFKRGFSDAVEKAQINNKDQEQQQSGSQKQLKVYSKQYSNSTVTEQDRIKNEFKRMFDNIYQEGDRSPISMDMSDISQ